MTDLTRKYDTASSSRGCSQLESALGHVFVHKALLQQALTHRSFSAGHNERLEFLGDAVLDLVISHMLYDKLDQLPEGDLSRMRAKLVQQDSLHEVALRLNLPQCLRLGEGELRTGGQNRPSILADAVEALIGAVYLDGGYDGATRVVRHLFAGVRMDASLSARAKDAKTALQEWLQSRQWHLPVYEVEEIRGVAHQQVFVVRCRIQEQDLTCLGQGPSRRAAEQHAAALVLDHLQALAHEAKAAGQKRASPARRHQAK